MPQPIAPTGCSALWSDDDYEHYGRPSVSDRSATQKRFCTKAAAARFAPGLFPVEGRSITFGRVVITRRTAPAPRSHDRQRGMVVPGGFASAEREAPSSVYRPGRRRNGLKKWTSDIFAANPNTVATMKRIMLRYAHASSTQVGPKPGPAAHSHRVETALLRGCDDGDTPCRPAEFLPYPRNSWG